MLQETPTDIHNLLSVIFIGPHKFDKSNVGIFFQIRKNKVLRFLMWLKHHNIWYQNMKYDWNILDLYDDCDNVLPGLQSRIIHDSGLNIDHIFQEETAGFTEHPAEQAKCISTSSPDIFLDKMGVSDPEGTSVTGRGMTASALRNLVNSPSLVNTLFSYFTAKCAGAR